MKDRLLVFACIGEVATGLALLLIPSIVTRLLLGTQITGVSIPIARVTGIALVGLGVSCYRSCRAFSGMLTYSALVTVYLGFVGIRGELVGPLLWPVVALHAVLTLLLARARFKLQENRSRT